MAPKDRKAGGPPKSYPNPVKKPNLSEAQLQRKRESDHRRNKKNGGIDLSPLEATPSVAPKVAPAVAPEAARYERGSSAESEDTQEDEDDVKANVDEKDLDVTETFDAEGNLVREEGRAPRISVPEAKKRTHNLRLMALQRHDMAAERIFYDNQDLLKLRVGEEPKKDLLLPDSGGRYALIPDENGPIEALGNGVYRERNKDYIFQAYGECVEGNKNAVLAVAIKSTSHKTAVLKQLKDEKKVKAEELDKSVG